MQAESKSRIVEVPTKVVRDHHVQTKLGSIFITPTEADHLHVCTRDGNSPEKFLTWRGCEYYVSAHFYRWTDGSYQLGQEFTEVQDSNGKHTRPANQYERRQSLYISHHAASESARNKLAEMMTDAVNAWTAANPDKLFDAETDHIKDELDSAIADRNKAKNALAEAEDAVEELKAKLTAHKKGGE